MHVLCEFVSCTRPLSILFPTFFWSKPELLILLSPAKFAANPASLKPKKLAVCEEHAHSIEKNLLNPSSHSRMGHGNLGESDVLTEKWMQVNQVVSDITYMYNVANHPFTSLHASLFLPACVLSPSCLPACLLSPACLHACLPASLLSPACLPAYFHLPCLLARLLHHPAYPHTFMCLPYFFRAVHEHEEADHQDRRRRRTHCEYQFQHV